MTMIRPLGRRFTVLALLVACAAPARAADPPHVHLLATGGTISGGAGGPLNGAAIAALIPGLDKVATVTAEDFTRIGSSRMTPELQFKLASRINELFAADPALAGIVVTHGTDSLEETAFLVDLLLKGDRPVVFAAAQRPPRETDTDGPRNLLNAFRTAAAPQARGAGVLVTLNDELHSARWVRKTHAIALDAFQSPWVGPVGYIDAGRVVITRKTLGRVTIDAPRVEPKVDMITLVAGSDGHLVRAAIADGVKGLVIETFGRGNVPPAVMDAVKEARAKNVTVLFTTRTRGGRVEVNAGARTLGVIGGEDLDGLKARMLLCAALGAGKDDAAIQDLVERLSGQPQ
ncbi:MAG: asparaginase [Betaproteobacteria bacterium]